jgi:uncharacterized protein (TIGR02001 family)
LPLAAFFCHGASVLPAGGTWQGNCYHGRRRAFARFHRSHANHTRMNKKIALLALSALTFGALTIHAQTPAPAPAVAPSATWTITPTFVSQYMLRGVRLGGASFEPVIEYASGPLVLGLWSNFPLKDKVVGQSDPELDPYGSYTIELAKDLTLQPGFILYTYPNANKSNGFYKTTFEPSLALNYTVEGVKLTPKLYYDTVLKQTLLECSLFYAIPLKDAGTEIDFLGTYGTFKATDAFESTTPAMKNWGNYWLAGITLPFQINKSSKLSIGWAYTKGSDNYLKQGTAPKAANTGAVGRGVATISYAFTF